MFRQSKRIRKNLNRNISSYKGPAKDAGDVASSIFNKILVFVLAIATPIMSILAAMNILFRVPDFFSYEFDRGEITNHLDLSISTNELADFFSSFMLHKQGIFSLEAEFEGITQPLFSSAEGQLMANFRTVMDVSLVFTILTLILVVAAIVLLYRKLMPRSLRSGLNVSLLVYIAIIACLGVIFVAGNGDYMLRDVLLPQRFDGDDLLQQMFDSQFSLDALVAVFIVSIVIMLIIRYVIWKLTAQKGIFSEGLKGVGK